MCRGFEDPRELHRFARNDVPAPRRLTATVGVCHPPSVRVLPKHGRFLGEVFARKQIAHGVKFIFHRHAPPGRSRRGIFGPHPNG
jgi:hypothetical protein